LQYTIASQTSAGVIVIFSLGVGRRGTDAWSRAV